MSVKYENDNMFAKTTESQALSIVLSFVLPKAEAEALSKELMETFCSFTKILEAPEDELGRKCSPDVARYIKMLQNMAGYYLDDMNTKLQRVFDTKSSYEVMKTKFLGRKREAVALLLLDGRGHVLYNDIVNEGSISEVPIYIRRLVELCLKYDAYDAIIAHNHPSGNPAPSRNDLNATRDVEFALNGIDVTLIDHIIFAGSDYISMKSSEWLDQIKREVKEYKKTLKEESLEQEAALFSGRNRSTEKGNTK